MNIKTNTYKTNDLYYAAFLKTAGFDLKGVEKTPQGKKFFVFEDTNGLIVRTQTEYINGTSKVCAKDLIDNIRALKTLINME